MTHNVNLKLIHMDGSTQSRAAMNPDTVLEYREVLRNGGELPAVDLFKDGDMHWIGEGHHRVQAYLDEDRASIPANVREGTKRDAILFSCGANAAHGLRRTNEDKRRSVSLMLADAEWAKLSDRDIAKACNVSHTFVALVRNPKPAEPPAPPKPKKDKGTGTGGGTQTGGTGAAGNVATPPSPPPKAGDGGAAAEPDAEAENTAEEAHGDTTLEELLEESQKEVLELRQKVEAASADDLKGEAMKWRQIAENSRIRQNELQERLKEREDELKKRVAALVRIGKAVGEEDPTKVAATVEAFVRSMKGKVAA